MNHAARPGPVERSTLRAVWISDLHIGTREAKVDLLVDFLERNPCETLYLVGDIVDLRVISRRQRWLRRQEEALRKLLELTATTRIVVLPGNHDRVLRSLPVLQGHNISFHHDVVHTTATGQRLLVTHGDTMDRRIRTDISEWKIDLACFFYYSALALEHRVNMARLRRGRGLKRLVGETKASMAWWRAYRDRFEGAIVAHARDGGYDGVVCGHIHAPCLDHRGGVLYANSGDWVENCTAIVESHEGELRLLRWDRFGLQPAVYRVSAS